MVELLLFESFARTTEHRWWEELKRKEIFRPVSCRSLACVTIHNTRGSKQIHVAELCKIQNFENRNTENRKLNMNDSRVGKSMHVEER